MKSKLKTKKRLFIIIKKINSFIINFILFLKIELNNIISKHELKNSELTSKHAKEIEHLNKEKEAMLKSFHLEITEKNAEIHKLQETHSKTKT